MAETILTWNVTNWVTVLLMVAVGFAILGFGVKLLRGSGTTQSSQ